jgi:hypothetical protein
VQRAVRLARDDFLLAKLGSAVFKNARNEHGAVHHEAGLGHFFVSRFFRWFSQQHGSWGRLLRLDVNGFRT